MRYEGYDWMVLKRTPKLMIFWKKGKNGNFDVFKLKMSSL